MTAKEFEEGRKEIEDDYKNQKKELYYKYASSNNTYKIGDIIKDHYHIIRIKKIMYTILYNKPSCVYQGIPLRQDLTPKKKFVKDDEIMYQINVKEKINKKGE